jgi:hypothetical protein
MGGDFVRYIDVLLQNGTLIDAGYSWLCNML